MSSEPTAPSQAEFAGDLEAIARMDSVKTILEVICRTTGLGFSAVARVTPERWIACAVRDELQFGLAAGGELPIGTTLCNEVLASKQPIVIDDVANDPKYREHHTPRIYGLQSYISVPIFRRNGEFFGTLCAIDPKPAQLKAAASVATLELFAQLIALHLDIQDQVSARDEALREAGSAAEIRERFIAVLGHDVRNPLGAIMSATGVLERNPPPAAAANMVSVIKRSSTRIGELVDNLLDFARGRFGGGFSADTSDQADLASSLMQIIEEFRATASGRDIRSEIALEVQVRCDRPRVEQLLSNLIANALTHGERGAPVTVRATSNAKEFVLSVANRGTPIPRSRLAAIFEPFHSSTEKRGGLGLGLYICTEIARSHSGTLSVTSTNEETRFTFRMPTAVPPPGPSAPESSAPGSR
jgi:signal transduction histidine kinase